MKIARTSAYTGKSNTRDIPMDPQDWAMYIAGYGSMTDLLPYLTDQDREFLLSGMLPGEWNQACKDELKTIVEDEFA